MGGGWGKAPVALHRSAGNEPSVVNFGRRNRGRGTGQVGCNVLTEGHRWGVVQHLELGDTRQRVGRVTVLQGKGDVVGGAGRVGAWQ